MKNNTEEKVNKAIEAINVNISDLRNQAIEKATAQIETMITDMEDTPGQYIGENSVIRMMKCRPDVGYANETVITFNQNNYNSVKLIQPEQYNSYDVPTWEFNIHSSYYTSTSGNGDAYSDSFELLSFFGAFAKKLQEESPQLVQYLGELVEEFEPKFKALYEEKHKLTAQKHEIRKNEEAKLQQETLKSLTSKDGLDMPNSKDKYRGCGLSIRNGHTIYNVKNIKVLSLTKSKKSANIEVTNSVEKWDDVIETYIPVVDRREYTTVRYANIENFIDSVNGRNSYYN